MKEIKKLDERDSYLKIKEFILRDDTDTQFDDLIVFDRAVLYSDLIQVIEQTKKDLKNGYTNEDIYGAIDKLGVPYTIKWLGNLHIIEY